MLGVAAAAGNFYGMIGAILLMSYGLVDIPRSSWRMASASRRAAIARRAAGRHAADAEQAAAELCHAVAVARAVGTLLPRSAGQQQRARCDSVLAEVADAATAAHDAAPLYARAVAHDDSILGALRALLRG